jgi:hypothetical protein
VCVLSAGKGTEWRGRANRGDGDRRVSVEMSGDEWRRAIGDEGVDEGRAEERAGGASERAKERRKSGEEWVERKMGVERRTSETGDWRERGEWKGERREAGGGEAWRRGQTANGEWRGARREWIGEACEDNQEVPESAIKTGPTNTHTHTHTHCTS